MPKIGEHSENLKDSEKSHAYAVRLHPSIGKEKIAIDYLEEQIAKGKKMRSIMVDLVLARKRMGKAEDVEIKAVDAKKIMQLLKDILGRVKNGLVIQNTPSSQAAAAALDTVADDHFDQFERFLGMGIEADDFNDDDELRYVSDEE